MRKEIEEVQRRGREIRKERGKRKRTSVSFIEAHGIVNKKTKFFGRKDRV